MAKSKKKKKSDKPILGRMGAERTIALHNRPSAGPMAPKAEKKDEEQRKRQLREGDWDAF